MSNMPRVVLDDFHGSIGGDCACDKAVDISGMTGKEDTILKLEYSENQIRWQMHVSLTISQNNRPIPPFEYHIK